MKHGIAPHGRSIVLNLSCAENGAVTATIAAGDLLETSRQIKATCSRYASPAAENEAVFGDAQVPPMELDVPANGLILRRGAAGSLTVRALYPREAKSGQDVPVYLPIAVAIRVAELIGRVATGAPLPRQRTRSAPGAET